MILLPFLAALVGANPPQVAFKQFPGGKQAIVRVDQGGSNPVELTAGKAIPSEFGAFSWSSDGAQLVYASSGVAGGDLWAVDANGTAATRLTADSGNDDPAWSPKGTKIAYVHTVCVASPNGTFDLQEDIWLVDADGKNQRRLTADAGEKGPPSWSPDGSKLLFWRLSPSPALKTELFVVNAATGAVVLRTTDRGGAWSPDGSRIAVLSASGIDVVSADGSGRRTVAGGGSDPQWSPDGTKIAFYRTHCVLGFKGLCATILAASYVVPAAGGAETRLTGPLGGGAGSQVDGFPNGYDGKPTWWPNGSRLFFQRQNQAYVMNADGTCETPFGPRNLLLGDPAWRPGSTPSLATASCTDLRVRAVASRHGRLDVTVENDGNQQATRVKLTMRVTHGKATIRQPVRSLATIASEGATHLVVSYTAKRATTVRVSVAGAEPDSDPSTNSVVVSLR